MKTRSFYFILFSFLCSNVAFSQKGYTITGKVDGAPDSTKVYLDKDMISDDYPIDSAYIIKGTFRFKGSVPFPMECVANLDSMDSESQLFFWLENANITISATADHFDEAMVEGSKSNVSYSQWVNEVGKVLQGLGAAYYSDTATSLTRQFIVNHPGSYKSVQELYLYREQLSAEEEKRLYGLLQDEMKNSRAGKLIALHITNRRDLKIGSIAPDFTLQTADGKSVKLSSYRGKNVVLIFWASWCAPCRSYNRDYNRLFDTYSSKEIIFLGIALDKKTDMVKAVREDKLKWTNVFISGLYDSPILYQYGIQGVPHNVVIDKEGRIVESDLFTDTVKEDKSGRSHPSLETVLKTLSTK
jgi:peroxiredoxin